MPRYEIDRLVEVVGGVYGRRFIRIGDEIFVGDHNTVTHDTLAKKDNLLSRLKQIIETNSAQADLGVLTIVGKQIVLDGGSITLHWPLNTQARTDSIRIFQAQSTGYQVTDHW